MVFRKLDLTKLMVVTPFDASYAKEMGMKSQAGFMSMITTSGLVDQPSVCNLVEFHSGTISRVVKSTMAAGSASMSIALDRQLYSRMRIESVIHGEPDYTVEWRMKLKLLGVLVTDAKSLYGHLGKTGRIPRERHTLIDLLTARGLVENRAVMLKWMPTTHMLADVLTKQMRITKVIHDFLCHGRFCTVPTEEEHNVDYRRK